MANNIFNPGLIKNPDIAKQVIANQNELDRIKAERGWLGGVWGISSCVPNNIAALLIVILLLTGLIYTFYSTNSATCNLSISIKDLWSIITPLITLSVGYLFGDKNKKNAA